MIAKKLLDSQHTLDGNFYSFILDRCKKGIPDLATFLAGIIYRKINILSGKSR